MLTAAVVPGAALMLSDSPAGAASSPYALASWQALTQRWVTAALPGRGGKALQVVKVTDMGATASSKKMSGDAFGVVFRVSGTLPSRIYTVTAPGLGSIPLFLDGAAGTARAVINRCLPTGG